MRNFLTAIMILVLGAMLAWGAGAMPDTLFVHFPDEVVVSAKLTLPAGNYKFQRITNPTDPAVFTIINGDNHQVIGTTPSADLAESKQEQLHADSSVLIDEVDGKNYLDSMTMGGKGSSFIFRVPADVRKEAEKDGKQVRLEAHVGGQE